MTRHATVSLVQLEKLLLQMDVLCSCMGHLGSVTNDVSYRKACEITLDYVDWTCLGRRLLNIRRALVAEFEWAASPRRIRQYEKRTGKLKLWCYDDECKRRIERRRRLSERSGWSLHRGPQTVRFIEPDKGEKPLPPTKGNKRKPLSNPAGGKGAAAHKVAKVARKSRPGGKGRSATSGQRPARCTRR